MPELKNIRIMSVSECTVCGPALSRQLRGPVCSTQNYPAFAPVSTVSGQREDQRDADHAYGFSASSGHFRGPTPISRTYGPPALLTMVQVTDSTRPPRRKVDSQSARRLLWRYRRRAIPLTLRKIHRRLGNDTEKQLCRNESGTGQNDRELESGRPLKRSVGYRRP